MLCSCLLRQRRRSTDQLLGLLSSKSSASWPVLRLFSFDFYSGAHSYKLDMVVRALAFCVIVSCERALLSAAPTSG